MTVVGYMVIYGFDKFGGLGIEGIYKKGEYYKATVKANEVSGRVAKIVID